MPNYYTPYQPIYQMPQQMPQQQPQIQNGGFVSVRNEDEARLYPVKIGTSVTFIDETSPYIYTKTMGFSQLDRPIFEKYRLMKEEPEDISNIPDRKQADDVIENIKEELELIWVEIEDMKNAKKTANKRKEDERGSD